MCRIGFYRFYVGFYDMIMLYVGADKFVQGVGFDEFVYVFLSYTLVAEWTIHRWVLMTRAPYIELL